MDKKLITKQRKETIKMWCMFADDDLIAIANKEIKIEVLDRKDFISEELKVFPCKLLI